MQAQSISRNMMNFYRQYLLMFPEAARFTDVTFMEPSVRMTTLLAAASDAVERSDVLKEIAIAKGLKHDVTEYWGLVKSGQIVLPDALDKAPILFSQRGARG